MELDWALPREKTQAAHSRIPNRGTSLLQSAFHFRGTAGFPAEPPFRALRLFEISAYGLTCGLFRPAGRARVAQRSAAPAQVSSGHLQLQGGGSEKKPHKSALPGPLLARACASGLPRSRDGNIDGDRVSA